MVINRMRCHGSHRRSSSCLRCADLAAQNKCIKIDASRDTATAHRALIFHGSDFLIFFDSTADLKGKKALNKIKTDILTIATHATISIGKRQ